MGLWMLDGLVKELVFAAPASQSPLLLSCPVICFCSCFAPFNIVERNGRSNCCGYFPMRDSIRILVIDWITMTATRKTITTIKANSLVLVIVDRLELI